MKRHKPNRLFRAQASLSKRLQTRQLKMPQMWRLLMRVEKRIMVTVTWSLIFNGARAHTKKHSALERLSSLPSVFSSTFECSLFHDPLDTLALKGLSSATHGTTCARVETSKARVPRTNLKSARTLIPTNFYADELL